jgi:hypothetical protein
MAKKRRNWLLVVFGIVVLLAFVGIGAIIAISAWVQQNLEVQETTEPDASTAMDIVRQQFAGRQPLLELRNGRPAYAAGAPDPSRPRTELQRLHVLVWDPEDRRLARVNVPFWLLRLKATPIEFSAYASGLDDEGVNLRPEEIERYGPGIILDATSPRGERVLLWAE